MKDLITPYWTLAFEIIFYVVMALIFLLRGGGRIELWSPIWILSLSAMRLFLPTLGSNSDHRLLSLLMPQFGHLFIAGMMLHRLSGDRPSWKAATVLCLVLTYSLFGRTDWAPISPLVYLISNAGLIGLVWLAVRGQVEFLGKGPIRSIGLASYSLYLLHEVVRLPLTQYAKVEGWNVWIVTVIGVPLSIVIAILAYRFIELPGQDWGRRVGLAVWKRAPSHSGA